MSAQPLEARFAQVVCAAEQFLDRLDRIDQRLDRLQQRMDVRFSWVTGIVIGTWSTTMIAIFAILIRH